MSMLSPPKQARYSERLHIIHSTFGNTYLVLKDNNKQITSMYLQIPLEPDAETGFCKNRAKGVLLPWTSIPSWSSSKQVWLWQENDITSAELREYLTSLDIFANFMITESSGLPESCLQTPEGLKVMLHDRADSLNVQDIESLFPDDEEWLRRVFGSNANLKKVLDDASGMKRRAFEDANANAKQWKKRKTDAAAAATAAATAATAARATAAHATAAHASTAGAASSAGGSGSARSSSARAESVM
jgi:hypothetical protein